MIFLKKINISWFESRDSYKKRTFTYFYLFNVRPFREDSMVF